MPRIFRFSISTAIGTLPANDTAARLANVPPPAGAAAVSTGAMTTRCIGTPRWSATSCASTVPCPCPCEGELAWQRTRPSGSSESVTASCPMTSTIPRAR